MPRITGNSPSSTPPLSPRGNETPRHGSQGSSNTKHRSIFGSIGAALGGIGRSRKSSSSGSTSGSASASTSSSPPRRAAPGTPARGQAARPPIDTLRERGVDLEALRHAIGQHLTFVAPLPAHFEAELHNAGVSTDLISDNMQNANHPLLALSNKIFSELHPRRAAATPPRPTGLSRSPGLRRTGGETSPPRAAPAAGTGSPVHEPASRAPLEALSRAGIDPREFRTAVSNYVALANRLPANIIRFLQDEGIRHDISSTRRIDPDHPLLAFDQQVRTALSSQTPAAAQARPARNAPATQAPTPRRPAPAPLNSADFDESAVFAAPTHSLRGR